MPGAPQLNNRRRHPVPGRSGPPVGGPPLEETWDRLERTVERVESSLSTGRVPVTGVRSSLPLLQALGVPEAQRDSHLEPRAGAACEYCSYGVLCGREWENFT